MFLFSDINKTGLQPPFQLFSTKKSCFPTISQFPSILSIETLSFKKIQHVAMLSRVTLAMFENVLLNFSGGDKLVYHLTLIIVLLSLRKQSSIFWQM